MQMDLNRYRSFLDRFDWPEEQKTAALSQVWAVMSSFVDRAFGTAPEQQRKLGGMGSQRSDRAKSCAALQKDLPGEPVDGLDSTDPLEPTFNDAARLIRPARKSRR